MEDAYIIKGGVSLKGQVKLSGAKNVALKVIISALLFEGQVILHNIPRINDVHELFHLIRSIGGKAEFTEKNTAVIDGRTIKTNKVDFLHGSKMRVSFMLFAPLLAKFKECYVPNPGGCRIGARPIDRIIEGMKAIGIEVSYDSSTGYYHALMQKPPSGKFRFVKPSHTGTELLILIALLGKNLITLENTALEPEIDELILFLNNSGAKIKREGTTITISPTQALNQGSPFTIMSDRNEAVTYATLAIATKGEIVIEGIQKNLIQTFIDCIKKIGGGFEELGTNTFKFYYANELKAHNIETQPHPGFMTDWQPNWAVLMTHAHGESIIHERVFENRFSYVEELRKLGAEIDYVKIPVKNPMEYFFFNFDPSKKYNQAIRIKGPQQLHGGVLTISDLRAGASLAIAAFCAEGESVINGASILERGYEDFVEKTRNLGGEIKKM